ncbi:hypothetical protein [Streptomyces sp. JV178]|uniref:hypothetical protein n=1 Tax=Streptomyces sp. JV178 TaxID=858632 RepID=UPI0015D54BEE|nr:hypothetical protein [Streptomyces sp. JV178]
MKLLQDEGARRWVSPWWPTDARLSEHGADTPRLFPSLLHHRLRSLPVRTA